jgi:guanine deaminase
LHLHILSTRDSHALFSPIAVDDAGFISHCSSASDPSSISLLQGIDKSQIHVLSEGEFLLPTFVDLHLHAPQFLYQGTGLHLPLMQWLDEYAFKAEERMDADPVLAHNVYQRLAQKLIENGTGAVLLFGTLKEETK